MSDLGSMQDGFISRTSMFNESRGSLAQPKQRFTHPENPDFIQSMVRDTVSPRTLRTQPYVDARSPHNDKLRYDFYTGTQNQKFDKTKTPLHQQKMDARSYVDKLVTGNMKDSRVDDEALKK